MVSSPPSVQSAHQGTWVFLAFKQYGPRHSPARISAYASGSSTVDHQPPVCPRYTCSSDSLSAEPITMRCLPYSKPPSPAETGFTPSHTTPDATLHTYHTHAHTYPQTHTPHTYMYHTYHMPHTYLTHISHKYHTRTHTFSLFLYFPPGSLLQLSVTFSYQNLLPSTRPTPSGL